MSASLGPILIPVSRRVDSTAEVILLFILDFLFFSPITEALPSNFIVISRAYWRASS